VDPPIYSGPDRGYAITRYAWAFGIALGVTPDLLERWGRMRSQSSAMAQDWGTTAPGALFGVWGVALGIATYGMRCGVVRGAPVADGTTKGMIDMPLVRGMGRIGLTASMMSNHRR
jgi:hypothetical protein